MSLSVVTEPAKLIVSKSDTRAHLRVTDTDSDFEIIGMLKAARDFIEKYTSRILVTTQLKYSADCFAAEINLPVSPIKAIDSIKYLDENGVEQTLATSEYQSDLESLVPRIKPAPGKSWPATQVALNAVRITFTAGYGDDDTTIPDAIKHAALLLVGHWFENRETVIIGSTQTEIDFTVKALLGPYKREMI